MFANASNISNFMELDTNPAGATIVSPVLMFITGVIGNILALYSLYKTRTDLRTTKFYSFIKGLAWTDLLGILMTSPSVVIAYAYHREWMGGDAHCRFHGFTMTVFGLATPLIICAMAVERFLALKCVFFYSSRCRTGTARGCILLLWFGTILYGLLPLFGFGRFEKQYPGTWCYVDFHSKDIISKVYGYIYACFNLILIILIVLCNTYVVVTIFKTRLKRASDSIYTLNHNLPEHDGLVKARNQRKRSNDAEIQMIVLLCALTLVFTICYAPLMIRIMMTQVTGVHNVLLDLTAVRLASLNQTLDPWLYILLRRSTCKRIARGVRRIKLKCLTALDNRAQEKDLLDNLDLINEQYCDKVLNVGNGREIPKPDVMQNTDVSKKCPLPDITNTEQNKEGKDSCYVCHFQFGKSLSPDDDGMFVKILYVNNNSPSNIYDKRTTERSIFCSESRQQMIPEAINLPGTTLHSISDSQSDCTRENMKGSEIGTKETTLSHTQHASFQSEHGNYHPSSLERNHQSLRKTKSSNR